MIIYKSTTIRLECVSSDLLEKQLYNDSYSVILKFGQIA